MNFFRSRSSRQQSAFFPWERRGKKARFFVLGRVGPVVLFVFLLSFVFWVGARERDASGERQTRIQLTSLRAAVQRYLADHEGRCPESLEQVLPYLKKEQVPRDAWGRPFRFLCPSHTPGRPFLLMSDGPDGVPGGLDRIEL